MSHPQSCTDETCTLTYREHLLTISVSPAAMPSRSITTGHDQPPESTERTRARQRSFDAQGNAYRELTKGGVKPDKLAHAPAMLRELGG